MSTIANSLLLAFRLPLLIPGPREPSPRRRKQSTIDLIHASPHLMRDIGLDDRLLARRN
jgi:hypothetical protein